MKHIATISCFLALLSTPAEAQLFRTSEACLACHNNLVTPAGEDVSIGTTWRPSMMANAARDPYWHAGVRREVLDHPSASAAIQHECSACHMPMMRFEAKTKGQEGQVFANLPIGQGATLASDGVSCTLCHQLGREKLGDPSTFSANFTMDTELPWGERQIFGPHEVDPGLTRVMQSAAEFVPAEAEHLAKAEVCASCHTLITHSLGPNGETVGELPEQVPFLEWQHSAYAKERSCQDCHMPEVDQPTSISSVLGKPRERLSRHSFRAANFFMPRLLNKNAATFGVTALPNELDAASKRAASYLQTKSSTIGVEAVIRNGHLEATVTVRSLAGHKLPTAYPSRRAWLHLKVLSNGEKIFESGAHASGRISGNDNDDDPTKFEPHYDKITSADQVQIYEVIMADMNGAVTTGLLSAVRYLKDNRLLPRGFDKKSADRNIAIQGKAATDDDFTAGGDRVRYRVPLKSAQGPLSVQVALVYQPIGFRWARNLEPTGSVEAKRFLQAFEGLKDQTALVLTETTQQIRR